MTKQKSDVWNYIFFWITKIILLTICFELRNSNNFLSNKHTQRTWFQVLLKLTEIRLYLLFSVYLGTKRNSVWSQINLYLEFYIWNRSEFHLVPNQSKNSRNYLISVILTRTWKSGSLIRISRFKADYQWKKFDKSEKYTFENQIFALWYVNFWIFLNQSIF